MCVRACVCTCVRVFVCVACASIPLIVLGKLGQYLCHTCVGTCMHMCMSLHMLCKQCTVHTVRTYVRNMASHLYIKYVYIYIYI